MINKKRGITSHFSLKISLAVFILIGIIGAVLVFTVMRLSVNSYIENDYLKSENKKAREENYIKSFQEYITRNNVTSSDPASFSEWVRSQKYVYMLIYKDDELFFSSDKDYDTETPEGDASDSENGDIDAPEGDDASSTPDAPGASITVKPPTYEQLKEYAAKNNLYPIQLEDGTVFASITEFSEYFYYDFANIASLGAAILVFALVIVIFFIRIVSKVSRLAANVNRVSGGDMDHSIKNEGNDEISRLSQDVDKMRNTILYNLKKEKEARAANEELITSMSHDIRTPLTVLLGYLDIMKTAESGEQMQSYIRAGENTAMRLKELSDDMFNYFLVFGNKSDSVELHEYDAAPLLEQILAEHILLLREMGYTVDSKHDEFDGVKIITDAPNTMRIIDNIFSNLKKYSDINESILIRCTYSDKKISLTIKNKQRADSADVESNGIGLKTCSKLAELLSIGFDYKSEDGYFQTTLVFNVADQKATKA